MSMKLTGEEGTLSFKQEVKFVILSIIFL